MADGATRWLAGAVRTLQKRVEFLEAAVSSGRAPTSVSTQTSTLSSCTSPMQESGLDRISTVSSAMTRVKDPVDENASFSMPQQKVVSEFDISDLNPRVRSQNFTGELDYENCTMCKRRKVVSEFDISDLNPRGCSQNFTGELDYENCTMCKRRKVVDEFDISDLNPRVCSQNFTGELDYGNFTMCERVETAPVRHVSFAEDIEGEVLLEEEGDIQLEPAFVEASAALDDIREKLVAARLTDGWRFLAGAARVEAMDHSKKAMWANLLRIWSVGEDDDERAAASRQIAMTLDDHMDEKEDEEDEEDSEETEAAQRDTVTVTISEIMLWCTETNLWAMTDQFGTKMRVYAALRDELEDA